MSRPGLIRRAVMHQGDAMVQSFFSSFEEAVKVLRFLEGDVVVDEIAKFYPELMRKMDQPPHPIVLELGQIERNRLFDESGSGVMTDSCLSFRTM